MPDEINRKGLARRLRLSARVGDKRIVREIRRLIRKAGGYGPAFVLPRDLDLEGCMEALERRLEVEKQAEEAIFTQYAAEVERARAKHDALERLLWKRIWAIKAVLHCAYAPTRDPATLGGGSGAHLPGVRQVSERRAARGSDDPPE